MREAFLVKAQMYVRTLKISKANISVSSHSPVMIRKGGSLGAFETKNPSCDITYLAYANVDFKLVAELRLRAHVRYCPVQKNDQQQKPVWLYGCEISTCAEYKLNPNWTCVKKYLTYEPALKVFVWSTNPV